MDNAHLTRKQQEFFNYIVEYKKEYDVWPTYREIAEHFDYRSPNSVTQNIQALLKKGFLIKRNDEEYDLPKEKKKNLLEDYDDQDGIPIRGLIAAGYLQEAVEADLGKITLSSLFPNLDQLFALRVSGFSMKDVDIYDGDLVVLMDTDVKNGDIGAVLYNGETSLKKIFWGSNGLRLEAANESYDDIIVEPDVFEEVRIIGKYIGHINRKGFQRATSKVA
ncbi:MAG TPA: repressor LexA [Balneola sp.]|jgi:SOS regulatory protein LexA|nr:repressor LexA [Bacteroidota bacterium]MAC05314.1 repressor LexA [Balneola sp.]MAO78888.1 repressor LexA [Balneola sp.]MBF63547.1 repressor LexA [Balneola sp.]HAW79786.1 repressor LexA [Balneola sp.]|tara:strand:- start:1628 stop:2287 length:660 start_codon:yes stop_codon:yes gene_type:complete